MEADLPAITQGAVPCGKILKILWLIHYNLKSCSGSSVPVCFYQVFTFGINGSIAFKGKNKCICDW